MSATIVLQALGIFLFNLIATVGVVFLLSSYDDKRKGKRKSPPIS